MPFLKFATNLYIFFRLSNVLLIVILKTKESTCGIGEKEDGFTTNSFLISPTILIKMDNGSVFSSTSKNLNAKRL